MHMGCLAAARALPFWALWQGGRATEAGWQSLMQRAGSASSARDPQVVEGRAFFLEYPDAPLVQQAAAVDAVVWMVIDGPDPGHTGMDDIDYELDSDSTSFSSSNYEGIMRMASRLAAASDYADARFEADIEAMLALEDRLREEEQRDEDKSEAERAAWILVAEEIDLMEGELLEETVCPMCGYIMEHGHACSPELGIEVGDVE